MRAKILRHKSSVIVEERSVAVYQQQLDDLKIRAPFSGIVINKSARSGETISPSSAGGGFTRTGICTIVDMSSLEIEVDVNEAYIDRVQAGQFASVRLDAYPDLSIPASVIAIVPTADRQKATVKVRIGLEQIDSRILPDMSVKVTFLNKQPKEANTNSMPDSEGVLIKKDAIVYGNSIPMVWVIQGESIERRVIEVASERGNYAVISGGISIGEKVAINWDRPLQDSDTIVVK